MLVGSAMAKYLEPLNIPSESIKAIAIDPTHIMYTFMQYVTKPYEKNLAKKRFDLGDKMAEVYDSVSSAKS